MHDIVPNMRNYLLPIYAIGIDSNKIQEPVSRPDGYPSYQLSICLGGSGMFIDENNEEHLIEKGDIFFFSPNTPHSYNAVTEPWELPYIVFTGHDAPNITEYLRFGKSMVLKQIHSSDFDKMVLSFTKIHDMFFSKIDSRTERVSAMLYSLLVFISEIRNKGSEQNLPDVMKRLLPVMDYINRNIGKDICVDDLAEVLGVSPNRITALFKQAFDLTPVQVIRKLKLERAKRCLATRPNIKMNDLIEIIGFTSVSYFVTVFKKEYGMSPTEYRNSIPSHSDWW